jgi:hypothetical protein
VLLGELEGVVSVAFQGDVDVLRDLLVGQGAEEFTDVAHADGPAFPVFALDDGFDSFAFDDEVDTAVSERMVTVVGKNVSGKFEPTNSINEIARLVGHFSRSRQLSKAHDTELELR